MATNKINRYNFYGTQDEPVSMATMLAKRMIQARSESIHRNISDLEGSEHKLEFVKQIRGIDFINDSRATNSNAVWSSLESMSKPTTWIMSINSIDDISEALLDVINEKVRVIVVQSVYNGAILDFFRGLHKRVFFAMNIEEAVRTAFYESDSGAAVLFSPGVTSSAPFPTYRERGNKFKEAVSQL